VCFDEWGPLEIKPIGGVAWAPRNQPQRMRATYRRLKGTEQFFGFYDVHADCLDGLFRKRKRLPELFDAFERLRRCYPGKKLFVIMDNLHQTHDHRPPALPRAAQAASHPSGVDPDRRTEASWLNLIEAHFGAPKRFTLANTDDPSHAVRRRRVYRYLRYRHRKLGTQEHRLTGIRGLSVNKLESH
jgi:hypothetical protein